MTCKSVNNLVLGCLSHDVSQKFALADPIAMFTKHVLRHPFVVPQSLDIRYQIRSFLCSGAGHSVLVSCWGGRKVSFYFLMYWVGHKLDTIGICLLRLSESPYLHNRGSFRCIQKYGPLCTILYRPTFIGYSYSERNSLISILIRSIVPSIGEDKDCCVINIWKLFLFKRDIFKTVSVDNKNTNKLKIG